MSKIWLTSDLHLNHNKKFLYSPRGFNTIEEHNEAIINNYNSVVSDEDTVYILGDLSLNDKDIGTKYLERLKGNITVIRGNHDTDRRVQLYKEMGWTVLDAHLLKYKKFHFLLCHYPVYVGNYDEEKGKETTYWCLHGHLHEKNNFSDSFYHCYNVCIDANNNFPIELDEVIEKIKNSIK